MGEVAEILQICIYACDEEITYWTVCRYCSKYWLVKKLKGEKNGGGVKEREGKRILSKLEHIEITFPLDEKDNSHEI